MSVACANYQPPCVDLLSHYLALLSQVTSALQTPWMLGAPATVETRLSWPAAADDIHQVLLLLLLLRDADASFPVHGTAAASVVERATHE